MAAAGKLALPVELQAFLAPACIALTCVLDSFGAL